MRNIIAYGISRRLRVDCMFERVPEYNETVWEHFHAPHNSGAFSKEGERAVVGHAGTRQHGREVEFQLQFSPGGRIAGCRYHVYGCPATIALCSLTSEALKGRTAMEVVAYSVVALADQLGLPAEKRDAALTVEDAIRAAAALYNKAEGLTSTSYVSQLQV